MILNREQITKLAAEVMRRYTEKYGAPATLAPTVKSNTTGTALGRSSTTFNLKPTLQNPLPTSQATSAMKPLGGGLSKGVGGKSGNL